MSYACKYCGQQFDEFTLLGGHVIGCTEYIKQKYGSLEQYQNELAEKREQNAIKILKRKQAQLEQWVSEQHTCECCCKVMTEKFGAGRFCSRACANKRNHSEDTKQKISDSINKFNEQNGKSVTDKFCIICGNKLGHNNKSSYCIHCVNKYSEEKRSKQIEKMRGRSRWNVHRNQPSFGETFFERVLDNNQIEFVREFQVKREDNKHCYYLDFVITTTSCKIDLEIDGQQHKWPENKLKDQIRDAYLTQIGYIVYRIDFNDMKTQFGKQLMRGKVDKFLDFYKSC